MKVRIKETGEILNIADYDKVTVDKCDSYGVPLTFNYEDVEIITEDSISNKEIDLEQRRFELVKSILSSIIRKLGYIGESTINMIIKQAYFIIQKLKEDDNIK